MPTTTPRRIDPEEDVLSVSEERSDLRTVERREGLPGLPGGPGLDHKPLEVSDEVLDVLLSGVRTAEEIAGPDGVLGQLTRRLLNRALEAELAAHLGYEAGEAPPGGAGNARNGKPGKTILTDQGPLRIRSPRDRKGTFEPEIVKKRQTRWVGFDDRVISLYARGLTVREIQGHLAEIYGTEVSPDLISKITDTVLADAKAWQNRPLERVYPIVYLDALIVKIRDGHTVRNQACYVALGVNLDGERDVLGLWFQQTEGAKFWLHVLSDLKTRGVADILFVCVDGSPASRRQSRRPSRTRPSRPAWCIRSAPACGSSPTRTANRSLPTCARSTPLWTPTTPQTSSQRLPRSGTHATR